MNAGLPGMVTEEPRSPATALNATFLVSAALLSAVPFGLGGRSRDDAGAELRLLQKLAGERLLGRVFGLRDMLGNAAFVLAFVSAGVMLGMLGYGPYSPSAASRCSRSPRPDGWACTQGDAATLSPPWPSPHDVSSRP